MCTGIRRESHPSMVEFPLGLPVKERKLCHLTGISPPVRFGVHNNSLQNLRRGLNERVFYVESGLGLTPAPQPEDRAFSSLKIFRRRLISIVGTHSKCSTQRFVEFYNGRRRTIYEAAVTSLSERPVERKDAYLTTFVKAEKINFTSKGDPAPRVIQPRNVRYNVEVGRYLRPIEHHVYRGIDTIWKGPTVMKGYTVDQMGQMFHEAWMQFNDPVAIGFDMKRFDQHVSRDALEWEHSCYMGMFNNDSTLAGLLKWQIANKGFGRASDGYIKYKIDGCRMSGDMNTAMGNCLLSCAIVWEFCKSNNIKARLFNNGDDCVVICERSNDNRVQNGMAVHWRKYGFQCVVEPTVDVLEKIEFCQMRPVFDGTQYVLTRNPHVCLSKDTYSVGAWNSPQGAKKWCKAVGECGLALTGGLPIMQAFYGMLVREAGAIEGNVSRDVAFASGFAALARMGNREVRGITEESRFSFYLAFDIAPDVQVALENFYDSHTIEWTFDPQGTLANYQHTNPNAWILHQLRV